MVLNIQNGYVSETSIKENAWTLARYAAICQSYGLAPIIEPEVMMTGGHSLRICAYWTEKILSAVYRACIEQEVILEGTLLKPNMCLPGIAYTGERRVADNARATVQVLRRTVPSAVRGIMFLSGGQSEEEATQHLNAINENYGDQLPWAVSFSFGRALQRSCLDAWKGQDSNTKAAQEAFKLRAKANGAAQKGTYDGFARTEDAQKALVVKGYVG